MSYEKVAYETTFKFLFAFAATSNLGQVSFVVKDDEITLTIGAETRVKKISEVEKEITEGLRELLDDS